MLIIERAAICQEKRYWEQFEVGMMIPSWTHSLPSLSCIESQHFFIYFVFVPVMFWRYPSWIIVCKTFTSQSFSKPHPATQSNMYFLAQITFCSIFTLTDSRKKNMLLLCWWLSNKTLQCFLQIHICQSNKTQLSPHYVELKQTCCCWLFNATWRVRNRGHFMAGGKCIRGDTRCEEMNLLPSEQHD